MWGTIVRSNRNAFLLNSYTVRHKLHNKSCALRKRKQVMLMNVCQYFVTVDTAFFHLKNYIIVRILT